METKSTRYLLAIFEDEHAVLRATNHLRERGIEIADVYTPYPVHGLDTAMGIKRSRLPWICFFAAMLGCLLAIGFQTWVFTSDWPLIVGGKPYNAFPAFMPVAFELSVLFGGLITVAAFFLRGRLGPGVHPVLMHERITDDAFVMAIVLRDTKFSVASLREILANQGAVQVEEREVHHV